MPSNNPRRVLFYVQHLLGVGHVRRAALIARSITDHGMQCDVVLGGTVVDGIDWGHARCHALPPIAAADVSFSRYLTVDGVEPDEAYWGERKHKLLNITKEVKPDAVLIEQFPFGRRKFRHEILAMIAQSRTSNPDVRVVGSVRDVLVNGDRLDKAQFAVDTLKQHFNALLVHGDPAFIPFDETFPLASDIASMITYTGYVAPDSEIISAHLDPSENGNVVVASGGGAVGTDLLTAAMDARIGGLLADHPWRFLMGPNMPPDTIEDIRRRAPEGVVVENNRRDYPTLLANAALSISQGGYNTIMDIVRAGCPAVVVPFAQGGETEQTFRAARLSALGIIQIINEVDLSPFSIRKAAAQALDTPRSQKPPFASDGAAQSAKALLSILAQP